MGAEFNFQRLKATNKDAALEEGSDIIDQAAWEHGHGGYTGSFAEATGVEYRGTQPAGTDPEQWLDEHCEKWEAMLIIDVDGVFYAGALCSS